MVTYEVQRITFSHQLDAITEAVMAVGLPTWKVASCEIAPGITEVSVIYEADGDDSELHGKLENAISEWGLD